MLKIVQLTELEQAQVKATYDAIVACRLGIEKAQEEYRKAVIDHTAMLRTICKINEAKEKIHLQLTDDANAIVIMGG
jgi:hypothetical protein